MVLRQARVELEQAPAAPAGADAEAYLNALIHEPAYRIDARNAPMIRALALHDAAQGRWLLQLPCHHLIMDHTTLELISAEIALISQGARASLAAPVPFRDFVAQARLGLSADEHRRFFSGMLADVDAPTAPFGRLDVQGDGSRADECVQRVDPGVSLALRSLARRHGVSPAAVFHLAWAQVLALTTGRDDVVFGTLLFGRMRGGAEVDRAVGMFINTLPIRVRLRRKGLAVALKQTQSALMDLLAHEHAPLQLALRCSGVPAGTPLFSTLLNYRYSAGADGGTALWEGVRTIGGRERTNYPLTLSIDDLGEGFRIVVLAEAGIDPHRIAAYVQSTLAQLIDTSNDQPASPAAMGLEESRTLEQWSRGVPGLPQAFTHHLIESQAARRGDAVALVYEGQQVGYADLNARAGPDVTVGVALPRSVELVVSLLAVMKAGGAYVPIDAELPAERVAYMLRDSGVTRVVSDGATLAGLALPAGVQALDLDTLVLADEPDHNPDVVLHPEHLAYVIYTSGSTGKPKGAANRHGSLHNRLAWMQAEYGLTPDDVVLQKTPFSFDVSVWEFFWPLMGRTMWCCRRRRSALTYRCGSSSGR
ncbi:hypothetical protein ASE30_28215 [Achromobacter sp. Root83]|nr:AMP-binding protein [Achromobacter sp. Root83]KRC74191.1 hypothetical protein ASE30_28215 [Achromobacter sp. Root83]